MLFNKETLLESSARAFFATAQDQNSEVRLFWAEQWKERKWGSKWDGVQHSRSPVFALLICWCFHRSPEAELRRPVSSRAAGRRLLAARLLQLSPESFPAFLCPELCFLVPVSFLLSCGDLSPSALCPELEKPRKHQSRLRQELCLSCEEHSSRRTFRRRVESREHAGGRTSRINAAKEITCLCLWHIDPHQQKL